MATLRILISSMETTIENAVRGRGRPRDPVIDRVVAEAALDLLAEHGYEGLTVEAVAQRAGVAKTTIYRRFGSKAELTAGAVMILAAAGRAPNAGAGSTRDSLVAILREVIRALRNTVAGQIIPDLVGAMPSHPELIEAFAKFAEPRRAVFFEVLRRGVENGELRPDIDFELAADLLYGPIYYRLLVTRKPLKPSDAERIVDAVMRGKGISPD